MGYILGLYSEIEKRTCNNLALAAGGAAEDDVAFLRDVGVGVRGLVF